MTAGPTAPPACLARRFAAEVLGSAALLIAVVGSGIMAERLAGGNVALALLANAIATGAALVVLITALGPISGAHFNPAVTLVMALRREIAGRTALAFLAAQVIGAVAGVAIAHAMFDAPAFSYSVHARAGAGQWLGEFVATFGLVATILLCRAARAESVAWAVGLYIAGAYWFTSSTSFANPAVTIARSLTDSFSGIAPADAPAFIAMQLAGAVAGALACGWMLRPSSLFSAAVPGHGSAEIDAASHAHASHAHGGRPGAQPPFCR